MKTAECQLTDGEVSLIVETVERWSASMGHDWDTWIQNYASDAVLMPPDSTRIVGAEDIRAYFQGAFTDIGMVRLSHWSVDGVGDLAVVNNDIDMVLPGQSSLSAKQIIVLRREEDGQWRVKQVCFNSPGG